MTDEERAGLLWEGLNDCAALDKRIAVATVSHWLEHHGAGYPDVPLIEEKVRDDARFWASCAQQHELEAYVAAGIAEMENAPMTEKQLRRLLAVAYRRLSPEGRIAAKKWMDTQ